MIHEVCLLKNSTALSLPHPQQNSDSASVSHQSISTPHEKPTVSLAEVIVPNANLRSGPSTKAMVVGQLTRGDTVQIISHSDRHWTEIRHNDGSAYIYSPLIKDINNKTFFNKMWEERSIIQIGHIWNTDKVIYKGERYIVTIDGGDVFFENEPESKRIKLSPGKHEFIASQSGRIAFIGAVNQHVKISVKKLKSNVNPASMSIEGWEESGTMTQKGQVWGTRHILYPHDQSTVYISGGDVLLVGSNRSRKRLSPGVHKLGWARSGPAVFISDADTKVNIKVIKVKN